MYTRHAVVNLDELGAVTLVAAGPDLVGVYFPGHWTNPDQTAFGLEVDCETDPVLSEAGAQLRQYLKGERTRFELDTATRGSAFEERVWALLRAVPFGATTTYGELAETLGDKTLARRVGQAVGRNPLSIVIGCHRVVGKNGELRGYAGGLERKQFLLELEGACEAPQAFPQLELATAGQGRARVSLWPHGPSARTDLGKGAHDAEAAGHSLLDAVDRRRG